MVESPTTGVVVAANVTFDDYLAHYAAAFHEYVKGNVVSMSPIDLRHDELSN
ncbi:MAG TPA: hypothetical protein VMT34_06555 [Aggregatilineales bacterium]|nr:hypothetical protein [Aggregatilineales bacterium]